MKKQLIILNILAVFFFLVCWLLLPFELSDRFMFQTADSNSYLEVANWVFKGEETINTAVRPVAYPFLLGISYYSLGNFGVWFLQFLAWLACINLTFVGAKKWSRNAIVPWVAAVVLMINLSLVAHTFHGLTEVITAMLLSLLFFHVTNSAKRFDQPRFGVRVLLILVLLTLVKPVFFYPTIVCLFLILFAYRKIYSRDLKRLVFPIVVIIPILLQMVIVQTRHGSFQVSQIGGITFKNYYFAQCVREIEGIEDVEQSKAFVAEMTSDEQFDYMVEHKTLFIKQFGKNVLLNLKADPAFLVNAKGETTLAHVYMRYYNLVGLGVNTLGMVIVLFLFLRAFFKRDKEVWIPLFILGGLLGYFLITTGISFWQGDRLVLPAIAIWIPLYSVLSFEMGTKFFGRKGMP